MKQNTFRIEGDRRILLLLTLYATVVLMLMSMDSPLHYIYNRHDSAWFFMCGKAMMNGLCPYVDFTDSKGPLLWLIYGVGYLISPRNYVGVYVLSCLCYGGILYYNYKTARLLLGDERRSLLVTLVMPLFYFLYWFHNEVRAEDFCTLPVAASLYCLFRLLYDGSGSVAAQPSVRRCGLVMGASFMSLVLIKYNIAAMQGLMMVIALWYYFRKNRNLAWAYIGWSATGVFAVALPMLVYLLSVGSFSGFIQEFFINTLQTLDMQKGVQKTYSDDLQKALDTPPRQFLLLAIAAGALLLSRRLTNWRFVPMLVGVFFFVIAVRHSYYYYYTICHIFYIYILIYMAGLSMKPVKALHLAVAVMTVVSWGVFENVRDHSQLESVAKWGGDKKKQKKIEESQSITNAVSRFVKPRILNLFYYEQGFEVPCEGLPAGKYFARQNGMTPEMEAEHVELLRSGKADFVIVGDRKRCDRRGFKRSVIEQMGYKHILKTSYSFEGKFRKTADVYQRKVIH